MCHVVDIEMEGLLDTRTTFNFPRYIQPCRFPVLTSHDNDDKTLLYEDYL